MVLSLFWLAFSAGCSSSEPEAVQEEEDVSISLPGGGKIRLDKAGGEVSISGENGVFEVKSSDQGVEYPARLEEEFPLCPGCKAIQVSNIGGYTTVGLKSTGTVGEVYDYYLEKAEAAGYSVGLKNQGKAMSMFMAEKEGKNFSCTAESDDEGSILASLRYSSGN